MCAPVSEPPRMPEEFEPKATPRSQFRIIPPAPVRPGLFPDEARFAMRLSILVGCTELAAWAWFARTAAGAAGPRGAVLGWAAGRLLKPVWALLGTRLPRPAVAYALLFLAVFGAAAGLLGGQFASAALIAVALPALADLCASCAADSITVERRSTAYAWLDMAQGLGGAVGLALGASFAGVAGVVGALALLAGAVGLPELRNRGTPRSTWTADAYLRVLQSPFGSQLVALAFFGGFPATQPFAKPLPGWGRRPLPPPGVGVFA